MKVVTEILRYVFAIILGLCIFAKLLSAYLGDTFLQEEYVLNKIEESGYYTKLYDLVYNNFNNYIMQSGFDQSILNDVITIDKLKSDTKIIIDNYYKGTSNEIETDSIYNKINENINNYLSNTNLKADTSSLKKYVGLLITEYNATIINYSSASGPIYNAITMIQRIIAKVDIYSIFGIIVSIIMIIVFSIKRPKKILSGIGCGCLFMGILAVYVRHYILGLFNFDVLLLLNQVFTDALQYLLNSFTNTLLIYEIVFGIIGLFLIVGGNYLQSKTEE